MGTRNVTCVVLDGGYKVAQYGQFDGYPSGVGINILKFLRDNDMVACKDILRRVKFINNDEVSERIKALKGSDWAKLLPQFSRGTAEGVLDLIKEGVTEIQDASDFAYDSLFCEWAYVIDFDKEVFEVYEGFNKEPTVSGRWLTKDCEPKPCGNSTDIYHPVRLIMSYDAYLMPTDKEFLSEMNQIQKDKEKSNVSVAKFI